MFTSAKVYSLEYKINVVTLYKRSGFSKALLARLLGISKSTLKCWIKNFKNYSDEIGFQSLFEKQKLIHKIAQLNKKLPLCKQVCENYKSLITHHLQELTD